MAVLPIVSGADTPVLHRETKKIASFTKDLQKLIQNLLDTVHYAEGAGLAAPQIGISERVAVARIGEEFIPLVNPEILWRSEQIVFGEEGCLSLPNVWLNVPRSTDIILRYVDSNGKEFEKKLSGFDARVVQHEVDHLDGILIIDYQPKKNE